MSRLLEIVGDVLADRRAKQVEAEKAKVAEANAKALAEIDARLATEKAALAAAEDNVREAEKDEARRTGAARREAIDNEMRRRGLDPLDLRARAKVTAKLHRKGRLP